MKKFINFIKKPRNLYLSITFMLILVMGLSKISFSYYITDSTNTKQSFSMNKINTFIQSDDLTSDYVDIPAKGTRKININVINNNDFGNIFKLYYEGEGVTVTPNKEINSIISEQFVLNYDLTFKNNTNEPKEVKLGIVNGYIGTDITVPGTEIK